MVCIRRYTVFERWQRIELCLLLFPSIKANDVSLLYTFSVNLTELPCGLPTTAVNFPVYRCNNTSSTYMELSPIDTQNNNATT